MGVITDQLIGDPRTSAKPDALIAVVREGSTFMVLFASSGRVEHLMPGMHLGLGRDLSFYYCGRRVKLLPSWAYEVNGEMYRQRPIRITLKDPYAEPIYRGKATAICDKINGIRQTYGWYALVTASVAHCLRRINSRIRRR